MDPNFGENGRPLLNRNFNHCQNLAARFGNDIACAEGDTIQHGSMCTLRCPQLSNLAPTFAELECKLGELHPPGFLLNAFWSDYDKQNGFQVNCAVPDAIPEPGIGNILHIIDYKL